MAATFNSTSNNAFESAAASPAWAHTLQAGSNLVAVVLCSWASSAPAATLDTVTYGGQSMTRVPSSLQTDGGPGCTELFYLVAPSGNQTVTCNFSKAVDSVCGIIVAHDAHQSSPIGTAAIGSANNDSPTITVTSGTDELSVACMSVNLTSALTIDTTDTGVERWRDNTGSAGVAMIGAGSSIAGSASAAHNWTLNDPWVWEASGVSIKPSAAAAGKPRTGFTLLGVG